MTAAPPTLDRRLRLSGVLLGAGLAVEALSMVWSHPTAFLAFLVVGGALVAAGVVTYLWSIASS